ncbi:NitT/TauT family transport system ATP-binding protein [Hathewaya proteolytica DSM 3090]|uniref:ABC-type quaternary amine transporter n=1 Tax=Hathewaya proteolytica DSM 3090 TaxID=1121331 RepID=A0A1M6PUC0_9CLOT|nr:ABC transporter ATP-binding protein [Hathewaya proteolytica]SHK11529.1 NitT/TauT family transport system ATP-binding protein [Hathewaya proteolytica DSM 3090]
MKEFIKINNLTKVFKTKENFQVKALEDINLSVDENDFICIVGPSGCGKSTLLRIIASLETATEGEALYKDKKIDKPTSEIGMVFQNYSLLQWRTVIDNISLGLEFKGVGKKERREKAREYLKIINMENFEKAYPYELSGGMQQRVAIARALVNNPEVLLMDEPFGALDAHTRIILQEELLRIWDSHKKTILFVTHSVDEAVYLSDKIVVMGKNPGCIKEIINVEIDRPRDRANPEYGKLTSRILKMLEP